MKSIKILSAIVIVLAGLSLFGYAVRNVTLGKDIGVLSGPIKVLSEFPELIIEVLKSNEIRGVPATYVEAETGNADRTELDYDVFGVSPVYDFDGANWEIRLFNFRNDSVVHRWFLHKENFLKTTDRKFENAEPRNPILLADRHLITNNDETNNLYRLDANSNIVWKNNSRFFHHSLNLGPEGRLWACGTSQRRVSSYREGGLFQYRDDFIVKMDINNGEVLYEKSVSELFIENGYPNFVYGFSNEVSPSVEHDPIHLNDIEPIMTSGKYWKAGDLLLSLRHRSLIALYRPTTNKIIRLIFGPFLHQHDVDVHSDTEISLFNNNYTDLGAPLKAEGTEDLMDTDSLISSQILIYNFEDSTFIPYAKEVFEQNDIATRTEGFHEFLSTGDVYVESQNQGEVFILNEEKVLMRKSFPTAIEDLIELPHWIRIYEDIDF